MQEPGHETERKDKLALAVGRALGTLARASANKPLAALAVVLLVTGGLGYGLTQVKFEENLLEILPRGHPDTEANLNLSERFPGHHSFININWKIEPGKWVKANQNLPNRVPPDMLQSGTFIGKNNVTDEVYLRALEEYYEWVQQPQYLPEGVSVFNIAYNAHVKLINYTNSCNPATNECDPASYAFPDTSPAGSLQFAEDWKTVHTAAPKEVSTQASPEWDVTRSVYVYVPANGSERALDYTEIGRRAEQAFLDYQLAAARGEVEWDVWDLPHSGITAANVVDDAHATFVAQEDLKLLAPIVLAFIVATLWIAFRSWRAIAIGTLSMLIGTVWTYGTMGYMGIKLNSLNLTVVPLILGVGIDFSIHMVNEFLENRSHGKSAGDAFYEAGRRSGFAMFVATLTTIVGLGLIAFSPSLLVAQMGALGAIAISYIYVLSILFIPAALVLVGAGSMQVEYTPSKLMPSLGRAVSRNRAIAIVLVIALTVGTAFGSRALQYETFGNPALNFPKGDRIRDWYDEGQASFFGTEGVVDFESNWVILQGPLTTPEAHTYIKALQEKLRTSPEIRDDSVTSIWNLVFQWEQLKRGTPAALGVIGQNELFTRSQREEINPYPNTEAEIRRSLDEMFACECMRVYASLFMNKDYDMTVILIDTGTGGTYEGAEAIMADVRRTIEEMEDLRPEDVTVSLGGNTAFSVTFIKEQMPWLNYVGIASNIVVMGLIFLLFRDWKATLVLGALMALTTTWWLGVLPIFGIGLAITLVLPLVFISAIGSDYGVHLLWSIRNEKDPWTAFENSGKSVFFSVITTLGAFAIFIPMTNLMMRKAMMGTTIAMVMIFLCTMLVIPLAYKIRRPGEVDEVAKPATSAPEPASGNGEGAAATTVHAERPPVTLVPSAPGAAKREQDVVVFGRAPLRK